MFSKRGRTTDGKVQSRTTLLKAPHLLVIKASLEREGTGDIKGLKRLHITLESV